MGAHVDFEKVDDHIRLGNTKEPWVCLENSPKAQSENNHVMALAYNWSLPKLTKGFDLGFSRKIRPIACETAGKEICRALLPGDQLPRVLSV